MRWIVAVLSLLLLLGAAPAASAAPFGSGFTFGYERRHERRQDRRYDRRFDRRLTRDVRRIDRRSFRYGQRHNRRFQRRFQRRTIHAIPIAPVIRRSYLVGYRAGYLAAAQSPSNAYCPRISLGHTLTVGYPVTIEPSPW